jgi:NAD(P)-dependent dehydrogenase (short-subunit alcohol dehydrogenase family)
MTNITLVTGASRGLGRNTALSIARHGGDVIITYRNGKEAADAVVAEIQSLGRKAITLQLDMSNMFSFPDFVAAVRAALKDTWGRDTFDHLINNAGHGEMADFVNTTEAQFDALFDVHVKAYFPDPVTSADPRRWRTDHQFLIGSDPSVFPWVLGLLGCQRRSGSAHRLYG